MTSFLTIYLNSRVTSGNFAPCYVNLATIVSIEPTANAKATIYFTDGSTRTTQDFYANILLSINQLYFATTIH